MRLSDDGKPRVLPELVRISDLDICKAVLIVIAQGVEKEGLVVGKVIRPAIVPSVAIAEKDELGTVIKPDLWS